MASRPKPATCIALLRAVNVAGHHQVGMADLRGLLGELGLRDVRSVLQSGDLIFWLFCEVGAA